MRGQLTRSDARGRIELENVRRPDGGWIGFGLFGAASDGGLAVLDSAELHVIAADGSPRGTFALDATPCGSGTIWGAPPAFDGRRVAWLGHEGLHGLDVETGRRTYIPRAPGDAAVGIVGSEVLVASPQRGRVDVFDLP